MKFLETTLNKLLIKIVFLLFIIITIVFSNNLIVKGVQNNNKVSDDINIKEVSNFIIDSPVKYYDDITKLEQLSNLKFKVPDFIPQGNKVVAYQLRKLSEKSEAIEIFYENSNGIFSFLVFGGDPAETLRLIETEKTKTIPNTRVESKKEPFNLGEITGLNIELTTIFPDREVSNNYIKKNQNTNKYFVWENGGLWYGLEYNSASINEETYILTVNFPQDIILNIAKSVKYPEEIKSVNYSIEKKFSTEIPIMNIYDKDDLEKAEKLLEFNPKFPLKINDNISITNSIINTSNDSQIEKNKIYYEINNFYTNKNGSITFTQGKVSKIYEDIKKNGYINAEDNGTGEKIKVEKLDFNNNEVYKYSFGGFAPQVSYIWKENNIYYSVELFVDIENSDEIAKGFINSEPL